MPLAKPTMSDEQLAQWCADMDAGVRRRKALLDLRAEEERAKRRTIPPRVAPTQAHDTLDIWAETGGVIARAKMRSDERAAAIAAQRRRAR